MKIALIVEGPGDIAAMPCLVAKTAEAFGSMAYAPNPIRAGCIQRLLKNGEIERYILMALSRENVDIIVVAIDLDDGCPVDARKLLQSRIDLMGEAVTKPVEIVLLNREYETLFLHVTESLKDNSPEYSWKDNVKIDDPYSKRDAKGVLNSLMEKHYKETTDQLSLTKRINIEEIYHKSRAFRRLAKVITQCDYALLEAAL